jgi:hypothetical protein
MIVLCMEAVGFKSRPGRLPGIRPAILYASAANSTIVLYGFGKSAARAARAQDLISRYPSRPFLQEDLISRLRSAVPAWELYDRISR